MVFISAYLVLPCNVYSVQDFFLQGYVLLFVSSHWSSSVERHKTSRVEWVPVGVVGAIVPSRPLDMLSLVFVAQ